MSDTPDSANDAMKLLDRGDIVVLFRSPLGTYTAVAVRNDTAAESILRDSIDCVLSNDSTDEDEELDEEEEVMEGVTITDDFTPGQALYRLTEKAINGKIA